MAQAGTNQSFRNFRVNCRTCIIAMGLFAASLRVGFASAASKAVCVARTRSASLPFLPVDWIFRFAPYFSRDRVRYMYRFNQISFVMGYGLLLGYYHQPFAGDHYDHAYESPLYRWVKADLERSGQLEENVRVKVHHFYPQEA